MNIREISSSAPIVSPMQNDNQIQLLRVAPHADTLITRGGAGFFTTVWTKVKRGIHCLTRWLKRIFCCCCSRETDRDASLARLKTAQKELKRRLEQLKQGVSTRQALQVWWREEYDSLHISVRKLLLLEDVKLYAPESANKEEWAKANIDSYKSRPQDYVANLYVQKIGGKDHDPLDDLANFIANVIRILEA